MPDLFIDGAWVASGDRTCSPVINPSDGTIVTEVDVATDDQVQAAIAAARRAFDTGEWPRTTPADRAALLTRVAGLIDRDLEATGPRGDAPDRQGHAREPLGHRGRRPRLPLLRRARDARRDPDRRPGQPGRPLADRLRAGRRLRADRPVELPAAPAVVEDRARAGGRQHRRHEAGVGDAADGGPPDPAARGGRGAGRGRQPRPGAGRPRRPGARRQPRRGPHLPDRRHRGRPGAAPRRGRQHEEGRARARRQEPEHRLRRCRLRDGRGQRADRRVHPFRPGLLGRLPGDRRGRRSTTGSWPRSAGAPT